MNLFQDVRFSSRNPKQASSKNQKRPLITITESEEGLLYDVKRDHCYIDPPPPRKKRKLRVIAGPRNNVALASNTRAEAALAVPTLTRWAEVTGHTLLERCGI